jgi:hypothetical protein
MNFFKECATFEGERTRHFPEIHVEGKRKRKIIVVLRKNPCHCSYKSETGLSHDRKTDSLLENGGTGWRGSGEAVQAAKI